MTLRIIIEIACIVGLYFFIPPAVKAANSSGMGQFGNFIGYSILNVIIIGILLFNSWGLFKLLK